MTANARNYVLKKMYLVNTVLILCHLGFALVYLRYHMTVLFCANFLNIALCLLAFICLKKRALKKYVHLLFYELYAFMIISILFLGWDLGFQHYCFSFTVAAFFCDFYLNQHKTTSKKTLAMGLFNLALYLALRIWTYFFPHIYTSGNPTLDKAIFFINSVLTFFYVTMYLYIYSSTVNKMEDELRQRAERDHLTGLYNRRKMKQILKATILPDTNQKFAIAMLDVDFFKSINDSYGHDAGDEVLKQFAAILKSQKNDRSNFSVCRWGGEEFLALYLYDSTPDAVTEEFEAIRRAVESSVVQYEDLTLRFTVTIGLTFYRKGMSRDELLKAADALLYEGKEAGRNRLMYDSEL